MKSILSYILILLPCFFLSQDNKGLLEVIEICPGVFKETKIDSSYSNFYISETSDTVYFNNLRCVILPQLTSPSTTIWKIKEGDANGIVQYFFQTVFGYKQVIGLFKQGHFVYGKKNEYYSNLQIKSTGYYENGLQIGIWKVYSQTGELEFQCEFIDGICISED